MSDVAAYVGQEEWQLDNLHDFKEIGFNSKKYVMVFKTLLSVIYIRSVFNFAS